MNDMLMIILGFVLGVASERAGVVKTVTDSLTNQKDNTNPEEV